MPHRGILLDTNILLCALMAPQRPPTVVAQQLISPDTAVYFSAANIWEIAIKQSLNRRGFDFDPQDVHRLALETGFSELSIQSEHCQAITRMPWHHRDPFDRMLVAQAQSLPANLLTSDRALAAYGDLVMVVALTA